MCRGEEMRFCECTKSGVSDESVFFTVSDKKRFLGGYKTNIKMSDEEGVFGANFEMTGWVTLSGDRIRIGGLDKFDLVRKSRKTVK